MSDWQPIETAPRDGTLVLLYSIKPSRKNRPQMQVGYCHIGLGGDVWVTGGWPVRPTHWMPLPDPPAGAK